MDRIRSNLEDFWALVLDVWNTSAFGINIGHLLAALGVFLIFWLLRGLFARFVIGYIQRLVKRSETNIDDRVLDAIREPLTLVPVIVGLFFALDLLRLEGLYAEVSDKFVKSLVVFAIFWAFYRATNPLSFILQTLSGVFTPTLIDWTVKGVKALFIFMGGATILELWGIQVAPMLAGLGLFGVAVALGAQDMFKNLIAGLLIIGERRFQRGDWVKVDGIVEGTVERINFRSTTIRRFDKAPVFVPNAELSDNAVTNFSAMTHRRIYWKLGVEYRSTVEQLRQIRDAIETHVLESDEFAHPPEVSTFVRVDAFNDSSIDFMLYCFTKTTDWGEWLEIKERLAYKIKDIVEGAGTGFAFPSQSIYVETVPEGAPEIFTPPEGVSAA